MRDIIKEFNTKVHSKNRVCILFLKQDFLWIPWFKMNNQINLVWEENRMYSCWLLIIFSLEYRFVLCYIINYLYLEAISKDSVPCYEKKILSRFIFEKNTVFADISWLVKVSDYFSISSFFDFFSFTFSAYFCDYFSDYFSDHA